MKFTHTALEATRGTSIQWTMLQEGDCQPCLVAIHPDGDELEVGCISLDGEFSLFSLDKELAAKFGVAIDGEAGFIVTK